MDAFLEELSAHGLRIIRCVPYPNRWATFEANHALKWSFVDFAKGGHTAVPEKPGYYCFFVGPASAGLPPAGYPLYAGETQDLRQRYRNYLTEKSAKRGRVHVKKFLKVFEGEVRFAYSPIDPPTPSDADSRRKVEKDLNDALIPEYSRKDFSAEVKAVKGAW